MKELKQCGRRELHTLFTRLATIIEEHSDDAGVYELHRQGYQADYRALH